MVGGEKVGGENVHKEENFEEEKKENFEEKQGVTTGQKKKSRFKKKLTRDTLLGKYSSSPIIVIDAGWTAQQTEKEFNSLASQMTFCYNLLSKFEKICSLYITDYSGVLQDKLEKMGSKSWIINFSPKNVCELFPVEKLIYLTGDAEEEMIDYDPEKIYIIGGMVDHNRLKLATYNFAKKCGIKTQKFPISKHVSLKTSCILSVNHSLEIMLRKLNGESWNMAIQNTIPKRKIQNLGGEKGFFLGGVGDIVIEPEKERKKTQPCHLHNRRA